jgi:hypothetical protein
MLRLLAAGSEGRAAATLVSGGWGVGGCVVDTTAAATATVTVVGVAAARVPAP